MSITVAHAADRCEPQTAGTAAASTGADKAHAAANHAPLPASHNRCFGPDIVRALAALLVVHLHACVPYLKHPMPGLVWTVQDTSSSWVSALFWSIELFIMPTFLVIAGYFAHRSWTGGGGAQLLASRARRLLLPLLLASVVLLPLAYYLWIVGWVIDGRLTAERLWRPRVPRDDREHLLGLAHLWFLHYVFTYCVVLAAGGWAWHKAARRTHERAIRTTPFAISSASRWVLAIASLPLVGCAVLIVAPQVVFGFQHAFLPVPSKWLYCATFFFGGVAIAIHDPHWQRVNRAAPRLLGIGAVCGLAAVVLGQWAIVRSDPSTLAFQIDFFTRALLAALSVAAAWSLSLGLLGGANRIAPLLLPQRRITAGISYLAAASFWIYLVHHPLVALIHIDLKVAAPALSPLAKSLLATVAAVSLALASYQCILATKRTARRKRSQLPQEASTGPLQGPATLRLPAASQSVRRAA
jgi:glucans biosynthesis protein C